VTVALVTGITGQDGSYLLERLLAEGVEVHGMVRAGKELPSEVRDTLPQVELHDGDLTNGQRLATLVHERRTRRDLQPRRVEFRGLVLA